MDKARRVSGGPAGSVVLRVKRWPTGGVFCLFAVLSELDDAA